MKMNIGNVLPSDMGSDLVARARAIAPLIAARAEEVDRTRDIPEDVGAALRDAGLFRLFQPAAWGGFECDPRIMMDVQDVIAEQCVSTAWVQAVLSVQPLLLALFPEQAQADVWGEDPANLVSSSFQPSGKVERVEGGFRLSGRWSYSSGSSLAQWAMIGGIVPALEADSPPEMRLFLVPRADYRIDDVWRAFGLRGTGSNDLVVSDVFVPEHRTMVPSLGIQNIPVADRPMAPLYRQAWLPLFGFSTSNVAIGAGRAALREFTNVMRKHVGGLSGRKMRDDPSVAELCARMTAELDTIAMLHRSIVARFAGYVETDTVIPLEEALLLRVQATTSLRKIAAIVEEMTLLGGARGVLEATPLTRVWLDLCAARLHPGNDPWGPAGFLGKAVIEGAPNAAAH